MKRFIAVILCVFMVISVIPVAYATSAPKKPYLPSFIGPDDKGIFAHGANQADSEAWQMWQHEMQEESKEDREDKNLISINENVKYFFIPTGVQNHIYIHNNYEQPVVINGTTVGARDMALVEFSPNTPYTVSVENETYTLYFKQSTADASIYVNNSNVDNTGLDLYTYLSQDKNNSASAGCTIVDAEGGVNLTSVKKIKGRGNTTWKKLKKPFNITFSEAVSIDGMEKGKKFSLLANYQDGSLLRNRLLYDLSDAVGLPYASDSRFVDLYMNGVYYGSYQLAQKIEVGSSDVINDIDDEAYLNSDGSVATDFPFLVEIDPSASGDDYTTTASNRTPLTIKSPEIEAGATGYDEVKAYVKAKFDSLYRAITSTSTKQQLEAVMDVDSFAKIYLINELGKNWDMGVSSFYMVYKQDTNGKWKFFASPVWDYDNSIGNALGVGNDFKKMDTTQEEYVSPTGWWCKYKKYSASSSTFNIVNRLAKCTFLQQYASYVWFKDFVPAIETFTSTGIDNGEIYSSDIYYDALKGTADCNYTRGWFLDTNPDWIADHTSLTKGTYNKETKQFVSDETATTYKEDFEGEYNYTVDWFTTRASWLSSEYAVIGDVNGDGTVDESDIEKATEETEPTEPTESISPTIVTEPSESTRPSQESTSPQPTRPTEPSEKPTLPTNVTEIPNSAPKIDKVTIKSASAKSTTSIKLTWTKSSKADGYVIYRKTANGAYKKAKTITKGSTTAYTFKKLKIATKYSFKINAYMKSNGKTVYSGLSNAKTTATKPGKVNFTKAKTKSPNVIKLNWKKVTRATGYTVYQKTGKKYKAVLSTKKASVLIKSLKPSKTYTYKIKAYIKVNNTKVYSSFSKARSTKTYKAVGNKKGFYKLYPNVLDFGNVTGASLVKNPLTYKENGTIVRVYMYYADKLNKAHLEQYAMQLDEFSDMKYYGAQELSNGSTIVYYTDKKSLLGISVVQGYLCISVTNV